MAYGTVMQQLLKDPENLVKGMSQAILEDIEKIAVDMALEEARPAVERVVKQRLEKFRLHLEKSLGMEGEFLNLRAYLDNKEVDRNA